MLKPIISEDEVPIRTDAWVKVFHEHSPPRVGVYAEVMNGGHPVVNANVTAHVYHEDIKLAMIQLRDSGGGKIYFVLFQNTYYKKAMLTNGLTCSNFTFIRLRFMNTVMFVANVSEYKNV